MAKENIVITGAQKKLAFFIAIIMLISVIGVYYIYNEKVPEPTPSVLGPSIISATPTGTSIPAEAPITIIFDSIMNKESVESAFSISPIKLGSFSWDERTNFDGKIVKFIPTIGFRAGTQYTVRLNNGTVDVDRKNLTTGTYQFNFTTEGETAICRDVGNGTDDFWTQYPPYNTYPDQPVEHPDWVVDAVETKVVMILSHKADCALCIKQTAICASIKNNSSGNIEYFDLLTTFDNPESTEIFSNYSPMSYWAIPLTIVLTKVTDSNGIEAIGWHSWVGAVDEATLTSWLEDAMIYHNEQDGR